MVQSLMEQGMTFDEAIRKLDETRTSVLERLGELRHGFIRYLESTIGFWGKVAFRMKIKCEEGYLVAAIESYKMQAYEMAIDYCNGSLSYNPDSARALSLRGFVQAVRIAPDYAVALADLEQAHKLEPENALYHKMLEIVRSAVQ